MRLPNPHLRSAARRLDLEPAVEALYVAERVPGILVANAKTVIMTAALVAEPVSARLDRCLSTLTSGETRRNALKQPGTA